MVAADGVIPMPGPPQDTLRVNGFFPFEEADRRLLFVVENAAFCEADDATWDLAARVASEPKVRRSQLVEALTERHGSEEAEAAVFAFEQLEIFTPSDRPRMATDTQPLLVQPLQSLVLHVAHDCNLRCGYCYADFGRYGSDFGAMDEATALAHVEQFFDQLADKKKAHVTFFGGEPLMNMPVVFAAHARAKARAEAEGRKITFSLTTNGTLLTQALVDFFVRERFTVTVSIDGPPDVNDRLRPLQNGAGSYEAIMQKVRGTGIEAIARVTLTKRSLDVARIVRHLVDAGFRDVGVSPVTTGSEKFDIPFERLDELLEGMSALADDFVEWAKQGKVFPFSNIRVLVEQVAAGQPRAMPCGAGTALVAADNKGDLYACHRMVGEAAFKIGSLSEGLDGPKRFSLLTDMHPRGREPCRECWARYLCGGGCHHIAWIHSEKNIAPWTIGAAFCDFLRAWYRLGLHTYARLIEEAPEVLGMLGGPKQACSQPMGL